MTRSDRLALLLGTVLVLGACSQAPKAKTPAPRPQAPPVTAAAPPADTAASPVPAATGPETAAPAVKPAVGLVETAPEPVSDRSAAGDILEDALSSYQEAQAALDAGDSDMALAKLDEAYGLIVRVQVPPDSPLVQEKSDLRILIAQRVQQVYALRLPAAGARNGAIPLVENEDVLKEVRSFQGPERAWFEAAYKRSGLFRPMIVEEFRKAGLPDHLSWLPVVESWFQVRALSRARALGLWQFISSTGYRYGLKRDRYVDERMDPVKATRAAAKYLAELHDMFGDWTTALASYNCGEWRIQSVLRAQRINYLDNFWDLYRNLPYETARFVPRFIAVLLITQDPAKYGFTLPAPDGPLAFDTVSVNQPVKLAALAQSMGIDPKDLSLFNPELRFDSTPNYAYELRVPAGCADKCLAALPNLPKYIPPDSVFSWHYVRPGDTLGALARRYHTTVAAIARLNKMKNVTMIYPGQRLRIPGRGGVPDQGEEPPVPRPEASAALLRGAEPRPFPPARWA